MDIISADREVGTYRGAAEMCGTTHRTVRRVIENHERAGPPAGRVERARNFDGSADLVAKRVGSTRVGSRPSGCYRPRKRPATTGRPATSAGWWPTPSGRGGPIITGAAVRGVDPGRRFGHRLGAQSGLHVFCAVLAWSRWRFVGFADNERAKTTFDMLARCFKAAGGVPNVVQVGYKSLQRTDRAGRCILGPQ